MLLAPRFFELAQRTADLMPRAARHMAHAPIHTPRTLSAHAIRHTTQRIARLCALRGVRVPGAPSYANYTPPHPAPRGSAADSVPPAACRCCWQAANRTRPHSSHPVAERCRAHVCAAGKGARRAAALAHPAPVLRAHFLRGRSTARHTRTVAPPCSASGERVSGYCPHEVVRADVVCVLAPTHPRRARQPQLHVCALLCRRSVPRTGTASRTALLGVLVALAVGVTSAQGDTNCTYPLPTPPPARHPSTVVAAARCDWRVRVRGKAHRGPTAVLCVDPQAAQVARWGERWKIRNRAQACARGCRCAALVLRGHGYQDSARRRACVHECPQLTLHMCLA